MTVHRDDMKSVVENIVAPGSAVILRMTVPAFPGVGAAFWNEDEQTTKMRAFYQAEEERSRLERIEEDQRKDDEFECSQRQKGGDAVLGIPDSRRPE